jgi:hypothetical protein
MRTTPRRTPNHTAVNLNAVTNAIAYAEFFSRSHDAVVAFYDAAGNVIETHSNGI